MKRELFELQFFFIEKIKGGEKYKALQKKHKNKEAIMNKQLRTKENIVRIKSDKLFDKLKEFYEKFYGSSGVSKNKFFNDIIQTGIDVYEKHEKDNWAFKNEKQTILDAIHEHTKQFAFHF